MNSTLASLELNGRSAGGPLALEPRLGLHDHDLPDDVPAQSTGSSETRWTKPLDAQAHAPAATGWRRRSILLLCAMAAAGSYAAYAWLEIAHPGWWRSVTAPSTPASTQATARPDTSGTPSPVSHASPAPSEATPPAHETAPPAHETAIAQAAVPATLHSTPSSTTATALAEPADGGIPAGTPVTRPQVTEGSAPAFQRESDSAERPIVGMRTTGEDAALLAAWQALEGGRTQQALSLYRDLLARRPDHTAAILGEAAALSRMGSHGEAQRRYLGVLALDPANAVARSNLLVIRAVAGETVSEQEIRTLVSEHPSADLYALLGRAHGAGGRWRLAHEALQTAHHLQPDRVDIAFNLAVSLEHLGEPASALALYRRIATASEGRTPVAVDVAVVARRIATLGNARAD